MPDLTIILKSKLTTIVGSLMVLSGAMLFLADLTRLSWLLLLIAPIAGAGLLFWGAREKSLGMIIAGSLFLCSGLGLVAALLRQFQWDGSQITAIILTGVSSGWLLMFLLAHVVVKKNIWWALLPGMIIGSLAACFFFSHLRLLDFFLYLGVAVGLALLIPGLFYRLYGLIIPGCLVASASVAVYAAWGVNSVTHPLAQTGVMLVVFSLGWGLITLGSRVASDKFIWWPLIPGGILAMTGWGLYIGGDPNNAVSFIGNTGSIGLIILGLYLLLFRRGLHR